MTFRLFHGSEIRSHLLRLHDHLPQQQDTGTHDFANHAHHPDNGVDPGKIAAVRPQFLPYIGNRVNPQHIHPAVCQVKKIEHHLIKDNRISVIQVPLIRIKGGHHILPCFRQTSEVSRRRGGKYLGHRLLKHRGNRPAVKEKISVLIFLFPCPCPFSPPMILRRMVHHKIQAKADASVVAFMGQLLQVLHGSQILPHLSEVRYGITSVRTPPGGI